MKPLSLIISSLKHNQKITFTSQGNSMYPLIPNNTKITIIPKKFSDIKLYDIVAVKKSNNIIIHQCLFKCSRYLICKGINNKFVDPPSTPNQVLGIVILNNYCSLLNLTYDYQLHQIHNLATQIPILILKGATWQKKYYGYYFNIHPSDIDILIHRSDYLQFKNILNKQGFRHQNFLSPPTSEITFTKNINSQRFCIDIHFQAVRSALNPIFRHPIDPVKMDNLTSEFWRKSISNNSFYFLTREYLLFYYCLNLIFHHGLRGTDLIAQIANIISKENIDWAKFWQLSEKYQMSNFVYYPLSWSSRLFKVKIPLLNRYRPHLFRHLTAKVFINRYTVFRPFYNLGKNYFTSRLNTILISFIRIILSE